MVDFWGALNIGLGLSFLLVSTNIYLYKLSEKKHRNEEPTNRPKLAIYVIFIGCFSTGVIFSLLGLTILMESVVFGPILRPASSKYVSSSSNNSGLVSLVLTALAVVISFVTVAVISVSRNALEDIRRHKKDTLQLRENFDTYKKDLEKHSLSYEFYIKKNHIMTIMRELNGSARTFMGQVDPAGQMDLAVEESFCKEVIYLLDEQFDVFDLYPDLFLVYIDKVDSVKKDWFYNKLKLEEPFIKKTISFLEMVCKNQNEIRKLDEVWSDEEKNAKLLVKYKNIKLGLDECTKENKVSRNTSQKVSQDRITNQDTQVPTILSRLGKLLKW